MVITRFAPSPTGLLHVGNIRTALVNWLFAKANNGKFILRIDDTDVKRSSEKYVDAIMRDLEWLGITWDAVYYQSQRVDLHLEAQNKLIANGRLYPCFESQEELEIKKKVALSRNLPPIYDRSSLKISESEKIALMQKNQHYWRFLMNNEKILWNDAIKGSVAFDGCNISDPVFVRADGSMTYMIATVADDIDLGITDIIRGEDHITNSAIHLQMFDALDKKRPNLGHLSLLYSSEGQMSKRTGGFDIEALRAEGVLPMAINSFLSKIGTSDPVERKESLDAIISEFSLSKFSVSSTNYNIAELRRLSTKLTHEMSFDDAKKHLPNYITKDFWYNIRPNLSSYHEALIWWDICHNTIEMQAFEDAEFAKKCADLLPEGAITERTWDHWIAIIKSETKRSGKSLFMPLRLFLTGKNDGPELKNLIPILGRDKIIQRLTGVI